MKKEVSNAQVLEAVLEAVQALDKRVNNRIDDVLAIVQFTQSEMGQMVTKTELDERFTESESRIMIHIDGVVQLYTRLDTEYVAM